MKISEALEKAADIQEKYGHCKGTWGDAEGRHCVQGSIALAVGQQLEPLLKADGTTEMILPNYITPLFRDTNNALGDFLKESSGHSGPTYRFNDDNKTEGTDVVRALREASAWQREREESEALTVPAESKEEVSA